MERASFTEKGLKSEMRADLREKSRLFSPDAEGAGSLLGGGKVKKSRRAGSVERADGGATRMRERIAQKEKRRSY